MKEYKNLTLKTAFWLTAPHTWIIASIYPLLLGTFLSIHLENKFSTPLFVILLITVISIHSAVNVLNDYYDYIKGLDKIENCDEEYEAILVYNNIKPKQVLMFGMSLLLISLILGLIISYYSGVVSLIVLIIGILVVLGYSGGNLPLSYLPIGEFVSGFTMGGLIPFAVYSAITNTVNFKVFYYAIPYIFLVAVIMMANNICDIQRDSLAGRKTLPILIGKEQSKKIYFSAICIWTAFVIYITITEFTGGILALPLLVFARYREVFELDFTSEHRQLAMIKVGKMCFIVGTVYLIAVSVSVFL